MAVIFKERIIDNNKNFYGKWIIIGGMFLTALLFAVGLVCLLLTGPKTVFLALLAGRGYRLCGLRFADCASVFVSRIFGMKAYADIFSLNYAIFMVGCIIGAPALGVLCDMIKSYSFAWIVSIVFSALLFLSFFLGIKSRAKLSEKQKPAEKRACKPFSSKKARSPNLAAGL